MKTCLRLAITATFLATVFSATAFCPSALCAQGQQDSGPRSDFQLGGRVDLSLIGFSHFSEADLDEELVLELETGRRGGVEGVSEVRVSADSAVIDLRDLYLDYRNDSGERYVVGKARKRFGMDWDFKLADRLTLTRSALARKLTVFTYSGRDTQLSLETAKTEMATHYISAHSSGGLNAAFLYRLRLKAGESGSIRVYSLAQAQRFSQRWAPAGAQSLAYSGNHDAFRLEGEAIVGLDPLESELNRERGETKQVFFAGFTAGGLWNSGGFLDPFARLTWVLHDLSDLGRRTLELTAGGRVPLLKRTYFGVELNLLRSGFEGISEWDSSSHVLFTLRYFF